MVCGFHLYPVSAVGTDTARTYNETGRKERTHHRRLPSSSFSVAHPNSSKKVLLLYRGDVSHGELGLAAVPDKVNIFREKLELTIKYAKALGCKRIHVLAAKKPPSYNEATLKQMEVLC
ncbi:putative hydroxypyruvate isomerase [Babylonia areolata]|uniref:putative hydroxypyruvate isomerase n=1 Tax=Babylonia areolata TaxID=304850 RepID=UPI003FD65BEC